MSADKRQPAAKPMRVAYERLVSSGVIEKDPVQVELVNRLDVLLAQVTIKRRSNKSSALGWLFGKNSARADSTKGLYIWGDVGRGKSMLMDLFFDLLPHERKRRSHFNDFMQDAQERIHIHRQAHKDGKVGESDPIPVVGRELADEARILCFDEFTVTDIADAMILGRLFSVLFEEQVVVVATSNVAPENLYKDGLNRKIFMPFIELLKESIDVFELDARTDFRLEKLTKSAVFHYPVDKKAERGMQQTWEQLTGTLSGEPHRLELKGRVFELPEFASGVARVGFDALCVEARSAEDYLALARQVHTLFVPDIPKIVAENRNVAKRFILLVDTLYDNHVRLIVGAAVPPEEIYEANRGTEAFEIKRTISRLHEMQSEEYIGT